ncbi:MAG: hypothetical protein JNM88_05700 [Chitinophagaceae bacterium]|nr:hypothetical protein [Chitinophagaceae bacterium]
MLKDLSFLSSEIIISTTLTIIISLPALGFILSSITLELWRKFNPKKDLFLEPSPEIETAYYTMLFNRFKDKSGVKMLDESPRAINKTTIQLNHQILLRKSENKEAIEFSVRRLDVFYTHINNSYTIIIGLIIGSIICICNSKIGNSISLKILSILPLLGYLLVARIQSAKALFESNEFEKRYLLSVLEEEGKK